MAFVLYPESLYKKLSDMFRHHLPSGARKPKVKVVAGLLLLSVVAGCTLLVCFSIWEHKALAEGRIQHVELFPSFPFLLSSLPL